MGETLNSENTKTRRFEKVQKLTWCDIVAVASKVMGRVIIERIQNGLDHVLRKEQAGSRKNKSTVDQIFIDRNIKEQVKTSGRQHSMHSRLRLCTLRRTVKNHEGL